MNRRSFFGLGAKVVGAATLGAHIALDKVGAQPKQQTTIDPGKQPLIDWQVTYDVLPTAENFGGEAGVVTTWHPVVTRTMTLRRGMYPPLKTSWNGIQYTRHYVSPLGYSVYYSRG